MHPLKASLASLSLAVLLAAAPAAHATQTVTIGNSTTATTSLGVIDQLAAPEVFSNSPVTLTPSNGALSFSDNWSFSIAAMTSQTGATITSYGVTLNSNGFSFSNLSSVSFAVYSASSSNPLVAVGPALYSASSSSGALSNLNFTLSWNQNPFVLQVSGVAPANTASAGYTGLITAAPVPEPGTWALAGVGGLALAAFGRRRQLAARRA